MDTMTSTILSGLLYDGFKRGLTLTSDFLKGKLQGWLIDDKLLLQLTSKLNELQLAELGEHVIERKLNESVDVQNLLKDIKPDQSIKVETVNQTHSGSGDNVVGNKTTYGK